MRTALSRRLSLATALSLTAGAFAALPAHAAAPAPIAYSSPVGDTGFQIFTMTPGGGDERQLTRSGYNRDPEWSADASQIAWACMPEGANETDVCLMSRSGRAKTRLTIPGLQSSPAFDPTGRYLAYVSSPTAYQTGAEIFLRDLATGSERPLTANAVSERSLAWSPDGAAIAFVGLTLEGDFELFVVDVASGIQHAVLQGQSLVVDGLDWSPQGERLVFSMDVTDLTQALFTIRPDGTGQRRITTATGAPLSDPVWSPSGRRVAFVYGDADRLTCTFDPHRRLDFAAYPWPARCVRGERFDLSWAPRPPA